MVLFILISSFRPFDQNYDNFRGHCTAESKQFATQKIYRALFGDAMLVPIQIGTNMAAANRPSKYIRH